MPLFSLSLSWQGSPEDQLLPLSLTTVLWSQYLPRPELLCPLSVPFCPWCLRKHTSGFPQETNSEPTPTACQAHLLHARCTYWVPGSVQFTCSPDFPGSLTEWVAGWSIRELPLHIHCTHEVIVLLNPPAYWHACPRSVESLFVLSFLLGRFFPVGGIHRLDSSAPSVLTIVWHLALPHALLSEINDQNGSSPPAFYI